MNKKVYLTILAFVTVACMIFGVLYHMTDYFHRDESIMKDAETLAEGEIDAASLEKIQADLNVGSLTIRTGDTFQVLYEGKDKFEPITEYKNGTLTIRQKKIKNIKIGIHSDIKAELAVVLPKETALSELDADLDYGKILLEGLQVEKGKLSNDLGDIDVHDCALGGMSIDIDAGDVDVEQCTFKSLEIDQDLGDVDVSTPQDMTDAEIDLTISLGSLRVNGEKQGNSFHQSGSGSILRISNDLGDVDVQY